MFPHPNSQALILTIRRECLRIPDESGEKFKIYERHFSVYFWRMLLGMSKLIPLATNEFIKGIER